MSPEVERALDKARQETPQPQQEQMKGEVYSLTLTYEHTLPGYAGRAEKTVTLPAHKMKVLLSRLENILADLH